MANMKSAKKVLRKLAKRAPRQAARRARMRGTVRRALVALDGKTDGKDKPAAETGFRQAQAELARAAQKGLMHKRTAARKTSRLAARLVKSASQ